MKFTHTLSENLYAALLLLEEHGIVEAIEIEENENIDRIYATYKVSLPQYPVVSSVQEHERVVFEAKENDLIPYPYFVREDFPRLPHLLRNTGTRKSPCLYTAFPEQIALQWNAVQYTLRVSQWLNKVSDGTLHEAGQPLEDIMLVDGGKCLIPLSYHIAPEKHTFVSQVESGENSVYFLQHQPSDNNEYKVVSIDMGAVSHSAIVAAPGSLEELANILSSGDKEVALESVLHTLFRDSSSYDQKLFFLVSGQVFDEHLDEENKRIYAFITQQTVGEIGRQVEILFKNPIDNLLSWIFSPELQREQLRPFPILGVSIHNAFNTLIARSANGTQVDDFLKVLQIGVGAIGSQLARNLTQSGFAGQWNCIDKDVLLPHNMSRYILTDPITSIGKSKVSILVGVLNGLSGRDNYASGINIAIPFGTLDEGLISDTIENIDLVIDTSASIPVQRTLDQNLSNRNARYTSFLAPNGKSVFLFYTVSGSKLSHTMLELYAYNILLSKGIIGAVLAVEQNGFTYGGDSCRAISAILSTHDVSMFSAVASGFIEGSHQLQKDKAIILSKVGNEIHEIPISTEPFIKRSNVAGKQVYIAPFLLEKISESRNKSLPNETGGVLLGTYDPITNAIYIVDHLPAPIDSSASTQYFHRGVKGIDEELERIKRLTHGHLDYIGEWHSHPEGVPALPSKTDEKLLQWLRNQSKYLTYPFLMLIQGDEDFTILA
jgi:integrative and conjugative element protein (TIGR02256 family)